MSKNLVNLTPHNITLMDDQGNIIQDIPSTGVIPRLKEDTEVIGNVNGIPVTIKTFGGVDSMPEPQADTFYIVSALLASKLSRNDLLVPSDMVRDDKGRIVGCKGFSSLSDTLPVLDYITL